MSDIPEFTTAPADMAVSPAPIPAVAPARYSRVLPLWKFALLSVVTLGIYELVWFYRQWKLLKTEAGLDVWPFWRAFFGAFLGDSLARHLRTYLQERGIACGFSPLLIGIGYFVLVAAGRLPDPFWLVSYFTFVPLLPLVGAMNLHWAQEAPGLPSKPFAWWQILLVAAGMVFCALIVMVTFFPE